MEQTLGKRISANRKRLGLTQDQLAEKLGVTAQAVSKWENDQSCPDISTLPLLADIFGISVDDLLGRGNTDSGAQKVHEGEIVTDTDEEDENSQVEVEFGNAKRAGLSFAILILLVGGLTLANALLNWNVSFWAILWPSALLVLGVAGLFHKFGFFSLGCALFGGFFLLDNLHVLPFDLSGNIVFPVLLLLLGFSLLVDALRKPKKSKIHVTYNGNKHQNGGKSDYTLDAEHFTYSNSFGEGTQFVELSRLSSGEIRTSFGDYTIDLSGVANVAENCMLDANCSFGNLTIRVPRRFSVAPVSETAFAAFDVQGRADAEPVGIITLHGNVSFGQIVIQYV